MVRDTHHPKFGQKVARFGCHMDGIRWCVLLLRQKKSEKLTVFLENFYENVVKLKSTSHKLLKAIYGLSKTDIFTSKPPFPTFQSALYNPNPNPIDYHR